MRLHCIQHRHRPTRIVPTNDAVYVMSLITRVNTVVSRERSASTAARSMPRGPPRDTVSARKTKTASPATAVAAFTNVLTNVFATRSATRVRSFRLIVERVVAAGQLLGKGRRIDARTLDIKQNRRQGCRSSMYNGNDGSFHATFPEYRESCGPQPHRRFRALPVLVRL